MKKFLVVVALAGCGGSATTHDALDGSIAIDSTDAGASGDATQLCVDTINMYRASLGLAAYTRWSSEESCASGEAKSDSMTGTAHGAFGSCSENAQDECPAWPGPDGSAITSCLAQMWAEGPGTDFSTHGHYINMSSTTYTQVACGFYTLPDGAVWATQNFK